MSYEWDEAKNVANKAKHGLAFEDMETFNWDLALWYQTQHDPVSNEDRNVIIGPIETALVAVVITERESAIRVISLRAATSLEKNNWKAEFYA